MNGVIFNGPRGFAQGAKSGAIGGAVSGAFAPLLPAADAWSVGRTVTSAMIDGIASVAQGGKFGRGIVNSFQNMAFRYAFDSLSAFTKSFGEGTELVAIPETPEMQAIHAQLQVLADVAAANIDATCGWVCKAPMVRGRLIHSEFAELIKALGPNSGFSTEVSYFDRKLSSYGFLLSSRADVVFGPRDRPIAVYDLKTGVSGIRLKQLIGYRMNLPLGTPFGIIKPTGD
jgi:hypothetical protein